MSNNIEIDFDVQRLAAVFESLDPEEAGKRAIVQVCEDMLEHVHMQIVDSEIRSPARLHSPYEHGPGPSLVKTKPANESGSAWQIHHNGGMNFTVRPRPKVRKRAIILEEGLPARSRSGEEGPYRFLVDGVPMFRYEVGPVKAHRYWKQAAIAVKRQTRVQGYFTDRLEEQADKGSLGSWDVARPV